MRKSAKQSDVKIFRCEIVWWSERTRRAPRRRSCKTDATTWRKSPCCSIRRRWNMCSCSFSLKPPIKSDAQGKLEEELCHAKNEIVEMKQVSRNTKSCHMFPHKFWLTCFPTNSGHVSLNISIHILPPKNVQVNRSSKSRAKRSDSERQRLMSRCQSLKESGAQAIAEKV